MYCNEIYIVLHVNCNALKTALATHCDAVCPQLGCNVVLSISQLQCTVEVKLEDMFRWGDSCTSSSSLQASSRSPDWMCKAILGCAKPFETLTLTRAPPSFHALPIFWLLPLTWKSYLCATNCISLKKHFLRSSYSCSSVNSTATDMPSYNCAETTTTSGGQRADTEQAGIRHSQVGIIKTSSQKLGWWPKTSNPLTKFCELSDQFCWPFKQWKQSCLTVIIWKCQWVMDE